MSAAKNFARSPLPTLAVWIADGLSALTLDLYGRAVEWRMKRQASRYAFARAVLDGFLIFGLTALLIWGLS